MTSRLDNKQRSCGANARFYHGARSSDCKVDRALGLTENGTADGVDRCCDGGDRRSAVSVRR
ncbi:MAG: hypothetical protein SWY16_17505 [Cyanobacteriota bacterium]|nr:hypothetical protein [Cyanobacteriota bacterium]